MNPGVTEEKITVEHATSVRVRYAETDQMGVVYNGNYFVYFEIGRTSLLRACGLPYSGLEKEGIMLPVIETHAVFRNPARYDDELTILTSYTLERRPVIRLEYRIYCGDNLIAEGYTTHSFIRSDTRKPVRPPQIFFDAIIRFAKQQENKLLPDSTLC